MPEEVFPVAASDENGELLSMRACFLCEGFLVTAPHHWLKNAAKIAVFIKDEAYPASVVSPLAPFKLDMAVLALKSVDMNQQFHDVISQKRCAQPKALQIGQLVKGIGYDRETGKIAQREGTYNRLDENDYIRLVIEMKVPLGFSGGPGVNANDEIIGMIEEQSIITDDVAYTYLIPIEEIRKELSRARNQLVKYVEPFEPTRRTEMDFPQRNGYRHHFEFLDIPYFPLKMGFWERFRRRPQSEMEECGLKIADGIRQTLNVIIWNVGEIFEQSSTLDILKCLTVLPEELIINLSWKDHPKIGRNREQVVQIIDNALDDFLQRHRAACPDLPIRFRRSHQEDGYFSISWDEKDLYPLRIKDYVIDPGDEIAKLSIECDGEPIEEYLLHDFVPVVKLGGCDYRDITLNLEYALLDSPRQSMAPTVSEYLRNHPLRLVVGCIDGPIGAPPEFHISANEPLLSLEDGNPSQEVTVGFQQPIQIGDSGLQFHLIPPDEKPSDVTIDMTFEGFILHTGMPVVNIGSSEELTLNPDGYIEMRETNTVLLPGVAPIAARLTHEARERDYAVLIECVGGELKIGHHAREEMGFTLKAGDEPMALQDKDLITIGDYSFRLDMTAEEERQLFPNITWIATLSLPEGQSVPGFEPIELTGSENQVNSADEFSLGYQRGGSPEPTRNLPCPWISRVHYSVYFKNRFFLRSGWEGIPGKRVYLLDEESSLHILDGQNRQPLGKQGQIFALPLRYNFKEREAEVVLSPGTPLPKYDPLRAERQQEETESGEESQQRKPEEGQSPLISDLK